MKNLTNLKLTVYEVDVTTLDENTGEYVECETEYVVVNPSDNLTLESVVNSVVSEYEDKSNMRVLVYEARCGDFTTIFDRNGELEFDNTGDIDTSTGYSGSPIFEMSF